MQRLPLLDHLQQPNETYWQEVGKQWDVSAAAGKSQDVVDIRRDRKTLMTLFPLLPLPARRANTSSNADAMAMEPSKNVEGVLWNTAKRCKTAVHNGLQ